MACRCLHFRFGAISKCDVLSMYLDDCARPSHCHRAERLLCRRLGGMTRLPCRLRHSRHRAWPRGYRRGLWRVLGPRSCSTTWDTSCAHVGTGMTSVFFPLVMNSLLWPQFLRMHATVAPCFWHACRRRPFYMPVRRCSVYRAEFGCHIDDSPVFDDVPDFFDL